MNRFIVMMFVVASLAGLGTACGTEPGLLGIRVPTGEGTIKPDAPYVITEVFEEGPAYRAGIRPDDVIIEINNTRIAGMRYQNVYDHFLLGPAGSTVTLTVERGGARLAFTMVRVRAVLMDDRQQ